MRGRRLRRRDGARRGPGGQDRLFGRSRSLPSRAAATRTLAQNRVPGAGLRAVVRRIRRLPAREPSPRSRGARLVPGGSLSRAHDAQ